MKSRASLVTLMELILFYTFACAMPGPCDKRCSRTIPISLKCIGSKKSLGLHFTQEHPVIMPMGLRRLSRPQAADRSPWAVKFRRIRPGIVTGVVLLGLPCQNGKIARPHHPIPAWVPSFIRSTRSSSMLQREQCLISGSASLLKLMLALRSPV